MSSAGGAHAASKPNSTPREVQVIQSVLKDMGVTDYEPAVVTQLLDFTYRYATDILDDAKAFSTHAGKKSIDVEDTKLAVQLKLDKSYTNPPPRELLLDVAKFRNTQALPIIKPYTGPKLPPDRYCMSSMNYQLRTHRKPNLAYNIQNIAGPKPPRAGKLSPAVSLVNRPNPLQAPTIRPPKGQQAVRQPTIINSLTATAAQHTSAALASALASAPTVSVKRKLEPDDDYDC